jgi:hypothetical protein
MKDTLNRIGNHLLNKLPLRGNLQIRSFSSPAPEIVSCSQWDLLRKLVDGIVQCPANGSLGQYVLVLVFHPLPESIITWFYILLAAR